MVEPGKWIAGRGGRNEADQPGGAGKAAKAGNCGRKRDRVPSPDEPAVSGAKDDIRSGENRAHAGSRTAYRDVRNGRVRDTVWNRNRGPRQTTVDGLHRSRVVSDGEAVPRRAAGDIVQR